MVDRQKLLIRLENNYNDLNQQVGIHIRMKKVQKSLGFTLVELIVVAAILGILVLMSMPTYNSIRNSARNGACVADLRTIEKAIMVYTIDKNALPNSSIDLSILSLKDPWGNQYVYHPITELGYIPLLDPATVPLNTDYDLFSMGQDGSPDTIDDIVRTNGGSYVGVR